MIKATWNGVVVAQSDETIILEGNHYFPATSLNMEFFQQSSTTSRCPWKGVANYYSLVVNGETNENAAWYYPEPSTAAANIKGRVAFWKGVKIT